MKARIFRAWLVAFGMANSVIALVHLFGGQHTYIGGGAVSATVDSDLRFFNVLFLAYGLAFIWAAQDVIGRARALDVLNVLFFLGGISRVLSWVVSGTPSWFYVAIFPVELIVPIVNTVLLRRQTAVTPAVRAPA